MKDRKSAGTGEAKEPALLQKETGKLESVHSSAIYHLNEKGEWVVRNPAGSICYNNLTRNLYSDEDE